MISYLYKATPPALSTDSIEWGKIEIETNDFTLYFLIEAMVKAAVDATSWRNRVEQIKAKE